MSKGEIVLADHLRLSKIEFVQEHRFHPKRKWRFDFALPAYMIAVEIEGAVWVAGRHTRGSGYVKDLEKYNEAALMGWKVLRFTTEQACNGLALETIRRGIYGQENTSRT